MLPYPTNAKKRGGGGVGCPLMVVFFFFLHITFSFAEFVGLTV
jgi:hypothetical protein